jgi:predicted AlkP superfamily pyrophosphatase or phosphodiesterase
MSPPYGTGTLAEVVPSLLASLGVPDEGNPLVFDAAERVCLLLVDALGWRLLRQHPEDAPFLTSLAEGTEPIMAGFPATTATSIAAIGTGLPSGQHGIVGVSFATPHGLIDTLRWCSLGDDRRVDLRERFVPEEAQPTPTTLQRAASDGVVVRLALPHEHEGSGLTRAVLRGGEFHGVHALGDLAATALKALWDNERVFCYAYHGHLDLLGHVYGPGSLPWRLQLAHIDRLAASIAEGLPRGSMLVITADHGMVTVPKDARVDVDTEPALLRGVRLLGGDARARHVYTEPGAAADVLATWTDVLGDRAWIATRDEAVNAGWFGPVVADRVRGRIGDLVVAARGETAIVRSRAEPTASRLLAHHGSLTPDEQLIPLLTFRPGS